MMFSVPQFIDVEDKIAGPLTWRQLLWMIGMGAILLFFYSIFDTALFIVIAVPTTLLFIGLAFYRPNGVSLTTFIFHGILFFFRPKVAVWERPVRSLGASQRTAEEAEKKRQAALAAEAEMKAKKDLSQDKLRELARILDSRGRGV